MKKLTETDKDIYTVYLKYEDINFQTAFTYLAHTGIDNFNSEFVAAAKEAAVKREEEALAANRTSLITSDYESRVIDYAAELAKLDFWNIITFAAERFILPSLEQKKTDLEDDEEDGVI